LTLAFLALAGDEDVISRAAYSGESERSVGHRPHRIDTGLRAYV
jgi:hypothetical protein